jgi:hypothetical protein
MQSLHYNNTEKKTLNHIWGGSQWLNHAQIMENPVALQDTWATQD